MNNIGTGNGSGGGSGNGEKNLIIAPQAGFRRRALISKKKQQEMPDAQHTISYIYFLRTREFRLLGQPNYKVGKTTQEPDTRIRRLEQYTKGSEVICLESVPTGAISQVEKDVLAFFRSRWPPGPDGSEYYVIPTEGEIREARETIHRICINAKPNIIERV
jgi:hypothetical protein